MGAVRIPTNGDIVARAVEERVHSERHVSGSRFTPAQVIAGVIGMIMTIIGGVAVARIGFTPITGETAPVLGIEMTSLMGLIMLVAGVSLLGAATSTYGIRSSLIGFGALAFAFGAIMLIEPSPFESSFGDAQSLGVVFVLIGLVSLIGGMTSRLISTSIVSTTSDEVAEEHVVPGERVVSEERVVSDDV